MALGRNPRAIARQIREGLGGNMVRALTIARTETLRVYRQASLQNYQANSDIVAGYYWRSSRSRRSCGACIALDGTFHPLDRPMRAHVRCRCTMIPGVKGVEVDRGVD
ncbi:MAG TPA: minor capsid protein, partial [Blastocatellia bacterium]|nr:minor capsid protein [Blastocatellia bacterium]